MTMKWLQPTEGFRTGIEVYNCIVGKKVPLILRQKHLATVYTCGPTVYDDTHIGHASTYVKLDTIRRILQHHFGIRVLSAMNVTDIDDKIIRRSQERKCTWEVVARENEETFWRDLKGLNVLEPHIKMRVTENIQEIVEFIAKLEEKKLAYRTADGSMNFKIRDYGAYGKLQKINVGEENVDFALWKGAKEGEPSWAAPWGQGRPGWHIECSAMASKIFGLNLDIHAGGIDLKFPHHENEEAQSCAHHDCQQWVNYWLHTGHLNLPGDAEKMSKSLKNTIGVQQLLSEYTANQFRMLCLLSNYRSSMIFSPEAMAMAQSVLGKFLSFLQDMESILRGSRSVGNFNPGEIFEKYLNSSEKVDEHLRDDFDTARAIQILQDFMTFVHKAVNSPQSDGAAPERGCLKLCQEFVEQNLTNFGIVLPKDGAQGEESAFSGEVLEKILQIRNNFRKERNFAAADALRDALRDVGVEIKDHGETSSWTKKE
ncbi:probable cysteine--tRNA ligase, mitochondrial [Lutzomyia longipalpis]|uniref:probable cysteine--tRNA ligase, mitochondrial n=1 Tax=Lutzomyia longipalpis TaxID=7200 RepID=UPI00248347CF|nr:probable cysteine--tRNA ligase, mitochondrial [Lutzomyia longipalpis]